MKIALYKGTHEGFSGLYNITTRFSDRGIYSHCEVVFTSGISASSSYLDGGVRFKNITYTSPDKWDFIDIPDPTGTIEDSALTWFLNHQGQPYDLMGNLRFLSNVFRDSNDKWFCSEAVMASLGFTEAYRYGPSGIASALLRLFATQK